MKVSHFPEKKFATRLADSSAHEFAPERQIRSGPRLLSDLTLIICSIGVRLYREKMIMSKMKSVFHHSDKA